MRAAPAYDDVPAEPKPLGRFDWERVIKRVQMAPGHKYLALTLATYANKEGERVRPGIARLARVMQVSEPTVKRGMKWLRDEGFIARTQQGNRRSTPPQADTYQLTVPMNVLELRQLDPDEATIWGSPS